MYYLSLIIKRKRLFYSVFLCFLISTLIVNLVMPKIYRGEYIVKMATPDFTDMVEQINTLDVEEMSKILPKSYTGISNLKLFSVPKDDIHKLKIIIEAKD